MHILHVHDRTGFFVESEWEDLADLKDNVRTRISKFMLDEHYNVVVELQFNRVQIWDDESQVLEYRWFEVN